MLLAVPMHGNAIAEAYSLNWHMLGASDGARMRGDCSRLSGMITLVTPEALIAQDDSYTMVSGFWVAAPLVDPNQSFFDGFEACSQ